MSEDGKVEIWWDRNVETRRKLEDNRPDITVLDRVAWRWTFVDFSVPWDKNVVSKEDEKINNYSLLVKEITKLHRVSAKVVPLVVGCLGVVSCRLEQYLKELAIPDLFNSDSNIFLESIVDIRDSKITMSNFTPSILGSRLLQAQLQSQSRTLSVQLVLSLIPSLTIFSRTSLFAIML